MFNGFTRCLSCPFVCPCLSVGCLVGGGVAVYVSPSKTESRPCQQEDYQPTVSLTGKLIFPSSTPAAHTQQRAEASPATRLMSVFAWQIRAVCKDSRVCVCVCCVCVCVCTARSSGNNMFDVRYTASDTVSPPYIIPSPPSSLLQLDPAV